MKASEGSDNIQEDLQVAGDVIGDTAYSERFVLKILLKLANTDTIKEESQEENFEENLCTLWDMTTEKDVVLFLLKHNFMSLVKFSLPTIDSNRIYEILIGILGNMCCFNEAITALEEDLDFLIAVVRMASSDDSLNIIQVIRLVNACVHKVNSSNAAQWLQIFDKTEFSANLSFILKNSTNKTLLITCLDCLNTICLKCNIEPCITDFFNQFVTPEIIDGVYCSFCELVEREDETCEEEELTRIFLTMLQIKITLSGFNKSLGLYTDRKDNVKKMISKILNHFKTKVIKKELGLEIIDSFDLINVIWSTLNLNLSDQTIFNTVFDVWKTLNTLQVSDKGTNFEDETSDQFRNIVADLIPHLCTFLCKCLIESSANDLEAILVIIGSDYNEILSNVEDEDLRTLVVKRTTDMKTELKDKEDA